MHPTMSLSVSFIDDPILGQHGGSVLRSSIVHATLPLADVLKVDNGGNKQWQAIQEGGRTALVAIADFVSRLLNSKKDLSESHAGFFFQLEKLDRSNGSSTSRSRSRRRNNSPMTPFMMERTDVWCDGKQVLHIFLRVLVYADEESMSDVEPIPCSLDDQKFHDAMELTTSSVLRRLLAGQIGEGLLGMDIMNHIAMSVLQDRLRSQLCECDAVAFVADGSILPRKSGASSAPMASPPSVPFQAPTGSPMSRSIEVEMGRLYHFLKGLPQVHAPNGRVQKTQVTLSGLFVPKGVTLIVGGGYHGKSTLLRTIAAGVYNKVPGDGREFCVTVNDALTVRAEDGRYVNNCNVSAFISNLPTPPGVTKALDTTHFSSGEASGSTSQAANVVEAIEMGATAFLVDEDVSAANFMARDGRMRSLVMDESITPLLYRVNGLYHAQGISSIVVVGGVGDWLDVPNAVILMDKYVCKDATNKAHSVSRQFSHGHVQYAGRGVVHRLPWEKTGTPIPRRPTESFAKLFDRKNTAISLLDGSDAISFHRLEHDDDSMTEEDDDGDDDEDHIVDLSRCEQLMGKKAQLYGCGLCALWLLEESRKCPELGVPHLLTKLDEFIDKEGFASVVGPSGSDESSSTAWKLLIETSGSACRPRKYEVGHALTRFRGIELEEIPLEEDDGSEAAAKAEAERKKRELLEIWNSRRKNKLTDETETDD